MEDSRVLKGIMFNKDITHPKVTALINTHTQTHGKRERLEEKQKDRDE